jgi:hypothetical protein
MEQSNQIAFIMIVVLIIYYIMNNPKIPKKTVKYVVVPRVKNDVIEGYQDTVEELIADEARNLYTYVAPRPYDYDHRTIYDPTYYNGYFPYTLFPDYHFTLDYDDPYYYKYPYHHYGTRYNDHR